MSIIILLFQYRGESFRTVLGRIGEIKSWLPQDVHVMALTATATKSVRLSVSRTIGMINPAVFAQSPCKRNIMYAVGTFTTVSETFRHVVEKLRKERERCPRTIIYCQSYGMCADIYIYFTHYLRFELTEPMDAPNIPYLLALLTSITRTN